MAAKKIIAPRLGQFCRAYPEVVLDIVIDDGLSDIVAGGFDVGIRVGERLQKDMIAVRLSPDVKLLAVASPDYLAQHGEPKSPADLRSHACISWRFPGSALVREFLTRLGADESEFEQRKLLQDEVIASIRAFNAGDRLSRDDIHDRNAVR